MNKFHRMELPRAGSTARLGGLARPLLLRRVSASTPTGSVSRPEHAGKKEAVRRLVIRTRLPPYPVLAQGQNLPGRSGAKFTPKKKRVRNTKKAGEPRSRAAFSVRGSGGEGDRNLGHLPAEPAGCGLPPGDGRYRRVARPQSAEIWFPVGLQRAASDPAPSRRSCQKVPRLGRHRHHIAIVDLAIAHTPAVGVLANIL